MKKIRKLLPVILAAYVGLVVVSFAVLSAKTNTPAKTVESPETAAPQIVESEQIPVDNKLVATPIKRAALVVSTPVPSATPTPAPSSMLTPVQKAWETVADINKITEESRAIAKQIEENSKVPTPVVTPAPIYTPPKKNVQDCLNQYAALGTLDSSEAGHCYD